MPTPRSHTHLQATQINAQPKLTNKYACPTHNDRRKSTGYNSSFALWRGSGNINGSAINKQCAFRQVSASNPPQRKAANLYKQA
jgi:hypothetical protein